jgi:hypothetical protein
MRKYASHYTDGFFAFAAGFMVRPYIMSDKIMTLYDHRKKPY